MPPLSLGIDEAGRGCVLGPLVVAVVVATDADRRWFTQNNVRDSKLVQPKRRDELAEEIKKRCWYELRVAHPVTIDEAIADRSRTLNGLELEMMADLLKAYRQQHPATHVRAMVDAPSSNARAFHEKLCRVSAWDASSVRAEHHADANNRTVGAASIIAKAERERLIRLLKQELGVDVGSGYCHDELTIKHMKTAPVGAAYVRWSWATAKRMTQTPSRDDRGARE